MISMMDFIQIMAV